jgi:hypothetical protein
MLWHLKSWLFRMNMKNPAGVLVPHATLPAEERGTRSQPSDNDRARWLALADAALRCGASEEDVAETEALARKEQAAIRRRIRPTAERVKSQSKSKH